MTKFYLTNATTSNAPSTGDKSAALPVGTFSSGPGGNGIENLTLSTSLGVGGSTNTTKVVAATNVHIDYYGARWTGPPLAEQTIPNATWTFAAGFNEAQASHNLFTCLSLYVWRPVTSAVVGYIYDADVSLGIEYTTLAAGKGDVVVFAGSALAVTDGDVPVLEWWAHANPQGTTDNAPSGFHIFFNGAVDVTSNSTSDYGSYLSTPDTLQVGPNPPAVRYLVRKPVQSPRPIHQMMI